MRLYLVPQVEGKIEGTMLAPDGVTVLPISMPHLYPKYFCSQGFEGARFFSQDYGLDPYFLVGMETTAEQHATLIAYADVLAFPEDLIQKITPESLASLGPQLDARSIPMPPITSETTYFSVVQTLLRAFCFSCQIHNQGSRLFPDGTTLDTPWADLTGDHKVRLLRAAVGYGMRIKVPDSTPMRDILLVLLAQYPDPIPFAGSVY